MTGDLFLERLAEALRPAGLNHVGVASRTAYDAAAPAGKRCADLHPATRSIVVVGSGGPALWDALMAHVAKDPVAHLARTSHPLDDFTKLAFQGRDDLLEGCRVIHPHLDAAVMLDFLRLGELAGLGAESELGLLVSARFGPWLGLRAAVFTPYELPETPRQRRLCDGCPAPCRTACPGGVVGAWTFPWERCVAFRRESESPCASSCASRIACVVAPEARYGEEQRLYHYARALGRAALCRRFGVRDEAGVG